MQNNRKLMISTAGSRKSIHWPKSEILWSEFAERLRTPVHALLFHLDFLRKWHPSVKKRTFYICRAV